MMHWDKKNTCRNCVFWEEARRSGHGVCRLNPPRLECSGANAAWPITNGFQDWCGQFKKNEVTE